MSLVRTCLHLHQRRHRTEQRTETRVATDTFLSVLVDIRHGATDYPTDEREATLVKADEFARDAITPMLMNEGSLGHYIGEKGDTPV